MSSSETCGHPAGAPQLLGTVAIKHLWRFVYDFQVYPPQCAFDATGTFPTYHQQQARTPLPSAEFSMALHVCSMESHGVTTQCRKTVLHFKLHHNKEWKTAGLLGDTHVNDPLHHHQMEAELPLHLPQCLKAPTVPAEHGIGGCREMSAKKSNNKHYL